LQVETNSFLLSKKEGGLQKGKEPSLGKGSLAAKKINSCWL